MRACVRGGGCAGGVDGVFFHIIIAAIFLYYVRHLRQRRKKKRGPKASKKNAKTKSTQRNECAHISHGLVEETRLCIDNIYREWYAPGGGDDDDDSRNVKYSLLSFSHRYAIISFDGFLLPCANE